MKKLVIRSPLRPDECSSRLAAAINHEGFISATGLFGGKPVSGRVNGPFVRIRKPYRWPMHNSFQTFLTGMLEAEGDGTLFRGHFHVHPVLYASLVVWCLLALAVGTVMLIDRWMAGGPYTSELLVPFGMIPAALLAVAIGRVLSHGEDQFLKTFVADTLHGREE